MKSFIQTLFALLLFLIVAANAQQRLPGVDDRRNIIDGPVAKRIDTYLDRHVPFGFSGAMLVAQKGKVLLRRGYGLADRERELPFTGDTVFYIGSITKQFTAAAILKLEMQGKLKVTDTLDTFFPQAPPDKAGITIHQLLTHTSGLNGSDDIYGAPKERDEQVDRVLKTKMAAEPGKTFIYSNPGFNLLGAIVEIASGQNYEEYLHQNLFQPAGMMFTGYRIPKWSKRSVAHGYVGEIEKGSPLDRPWLPDGPSWAIRGAGGMLSTVGDLYRWHRALKNDNILSAEARLKMLSPQVKESADASYGYGWLIHKTPRSTTVIEHNGSDGIFYADFRNYTDEETVVISVTNNIYWSNTLATNVPDLVFGNANATLPPPASGKKLQRRALGKYVGIYRFASGAVVDVVRSGDWLIFDPAGQEAVDLLTGTAETGREDRESKNARVAEILSSAAKGDYGPLRATIPEQKFDDLKAFLIDIFGFGSNRGVEYSILGTHPLWLVRDKPVTTFVRVKTKEMNIIALITWNGDKIRGHADAQEGVFSFRTPFASLGGRRFVGFNTGLGLPISVNFKADSSGNPTILEFADGSGPHVARRKD
jgi:CubicO group peptidase (beta-lactamase class C family)